MVYVLDYDTATGERAVRALPGEALEDTLVAAQQTAAALAVVRARLVDAVRPEAVEAGQWVAVYSPEHGWTRLGEDYRSRWVRISPRARTAVRADATTVPGRYLVEMARAGLAVPRRRWGGPGRSPGWVVSPGVQAFVAALPLDAALPTGRP